MTMSWLGTAIGRPCAGERMLCEDSIRIRASACASELSGRCTAIWSPSESALNAAPTTRRIWVALPSPRARSRRLPPLGVGVQEHCLLVGDPRDDVHAQWARDTPQRFGGLGGRGVTELHEPLHDEGLEQLERHLLGQAALLQPELRDGDDDRTAGVVDALAE